MLGGVRVGSGGRWALENNCGGVLLCLCGCEEKVDWSGDKSKQCAHPQHKAPTAEQQVCPGVTRVCGQWSTLIPKNVCTHLDSIDNSSAAAIESCGASSASQIIIICCCGLRRVEQQALLL